MVFNNDYDMSLWLLVNADYENKLKIMDLINNIPYDLCMEIQEKLKIVNEKRNGNRNICLDEILNFHGNCIVGDKLYFYSINPYNYGIYLGYSIKNSYGDYDRVYEINLFPFVNSDLYDDKKNLFLGRVEYDLDSLYSDESKDLYLSSEKFNVFIWKLLFQMSSFGGIINVKVVNTKRLNDDIILNNNRLVRVRKK